MDALTISWIAAQAAAIIVSSPVAAATQDANGPRVPPPAVVAAGVTQAAQGGVYDAAYYRRLDIHRYSSYAMLPLFALQVTAGTQLFNRGSEAPEWAKVGHRVGATGVAAMFATNLVTGIPNLAVSLRDPRDRGKKILHASLMIAAAAGFTATAVLAERAEGDPDARYRHRRMAFTSMGVAFAGWLTMLDWTDE
ncbi:MAG: hypothetical protein KF709_11490 [Gemmatimonadaceae bacterium]|nr:hypothetical protein [Gemmatimonadaceae bacterium]